MSINVTELSEQFWMATGGAMLVLLRSIVDGTRRTWYAILIGVALGAAGSWVAGTIWHDSKYVFLYCGAAAVMAENIILGLFNASREFREEPIRVFSQLFQFIFPFLTPKNSTATAPGQMTDKTSDPPAPAPGP